MYGIPLYVGRVLAAGASFYVSKNAPPEEVLEAVRRVVAARTYNEAGWRRNRDEQHPLVAEPAESALAA
jgi:DNA-binding NarL/FixJ family response regulator